MKKPGQQQNAWGQPVSSEPHYKRAARFVGLAAVTALSGPALAAEHFISPGATGFDCSRVAPGDTVTFRTGVYRLSSAFTLRDCNGTASKPINIRTNGRVEFIKTSTSKSGFVWNLRSVRHVVIDGGSGRFIVTNSSGRSPAAYVAFTGTSSNFTFRNVEIDGKRATGGAGIGLSVNDADVNDSCQPSSVCKWRENIVIERIKVRGLRDIGECLYIGPNWGSTQPAKDDWRLRNITIRNNDVQDCGRDGIQLKSAIAGKNQISGNTVRLTGAAGGADSKPTGQRHGISVYEGCADVTNNVVDSAGERGIEFYSHYLPAKYGPCKATVRGNRIVSPGKTGPLPGSGIEVGRISSSTYDFALTIDGNTIERAPGNAVSINGQVAQRGVISSTKICQSGSIKKGKYSVSGTVNSCSSTATFSSSIQPSAPLGFTVQ